MKQLSGAKFTEELATHESRMRSLLSYKKAIRYHIVLGMTMSLAFVVCQLAQVHQVTPLLVFIALVNFLVSYKYGGTYQIIAAVDFLESSRALPLLEPQTSETDENA